MLSIPCPVCGERNEREFVNGGGVKPRPAEPACLSDAAWSEYLYVTPNPKGWLREWWWHVAGCRSWFVLERNTHTHAIRACGDGP